MDDLLTADSIQSKAHDAARAWMRGDGNITDAELLLAVEYVDAWVKDDDKKTGTAKAGIDHMGSRKRKVLFEAIGRRYVEILKAQQS